MKYKVMRMLCMFDLPTDTPDERKAYRVFRNNLIKQGFVMMQFSVYVRVCPNRDYANRLENRIKKIVPESGNVRTIIITEKQYEDMKIWVGSKKLQEEKLGTERMVYL